MNIEHERTGADISRAYRELAHLSPDIAETLAEADRLFWPLATYRLSVREDGPGTAYRWVPDEEHLPIVEVTVSTCGYSYVEEFDQH